MVDARPDLTANSRGSGALSRRRLFGLTGAAGLVAVGATEGFAATGTASAKGNPTMTSAQSATRVTAPPPRGVLGANFNGAPQTMTFAELRDVSATWLRGFVPMKDQAEGDLAEHASIKRLLEASALGYGTVLSLKFPYRGTRIPSPGSPAMKAEIKRLDKVLPAVMGKVDILTIGNEPFIESRPDERDERLNVFYETLARHVIAFRDNGVGTNAKTQLYMGALNRLNEPAKRTDATERWMKFVHDTPALAGVDIHPHLPERGADQAYLNYILPFLRSDQTFLATEFSLVNFWADHLTDEISPEFAEVHPEEKGRLVWEVIEGAIDNRFPQCKWDDFLTMSPWFNSNRDYMRAQMETFRQTDKLAVATYGVSQDAAMVDGFDSTSKPWLLNSLFCPFTVKPGGDGLPGRNRIWADEFRALQRG